MRHLAEFFVAAVDEFLRCLALQDIEVAEQHSIHQRRRCIVIVMREVEGLSMQEIADVLGIRVGAAKVRLFRARQRLRELVSPQAAGETAADCALVTQAWNNPLQDEAMESSTSMILPKVGK